jgi:predicted transcriptional regulator
MQNSFFGCMFINVIGEYSDKDTAIRGVSRQFKMQMRSFIRELSVAAGAKDADQLADALALLLEGAIVTAQVNNKPEAADTAKKAAKAVIEQYFAAI